jgi:glycosyltransferase EpsD
VRFLGHVRDISDLYAAADVLVSASRCEGLPFCVMEGLYFGLPVIASDIKGHRDLVEHGRNGLLYNPRNTSELHRFMTVLGLSAKERGRLSSQAALPEKYLIQAVMDEFRHITGLPVPLTAVAI